MKRFLLFLLASLVIAAIIVTVAMKVSIPLAVDSDFQVLYYTDYGLVRNMNIYDQESKIQMISGIVGRPLEIDFIPQFAYPPWFALSTFYLGWLSIKSAATLWFELNLLMLFLSVYFLTDHWKPLLRLLAFPAALLFYPVLGVLAVGQYDFPTLLGASILIYAINHRIPLLTALGMSLLTFKPHLGGLILIAGLIHLFLCRDDFGRKSLLYTMVASIFLFLIGFLADNMWPISYLQSLLNYRQLGHITTCSECVNISVWLSRALSGGLSLAQAGVIGGLLLIVLTTALILIRPPLWKTPALLLTGALMVTILASPYLYNYDFTLLLIPFAILARTSNLFQKIILLLCYLAPTFALVLYGRNGNVSLIVVAVIVSLFLYIRAKNPVIDFTQQAAYNINN